MILKADHHFITLQTDLKNLKKIIFIANLIVDLMKNQALNQFE